jgi:hypothetical protein
MIGQVAKQVPHRLLSLKAPNVPLGKHRTTLVLPRHTAIAPSNVAFSPVRFKERNLVLVNKLLNYAQANYENININ